MSKLVRLYPKAWRERYEDEFLALLAERPPTAGDVLDTVRGALDAHLHPQATDALPAPWTHRIPGSLATTAGALWSFIVVAFVLWNDGAWAIAAVVPAALFLMFLSLPGDYMAAHGRPIAVALVALGLCIVVANLPYSLATVVAGIGGYLLALGGMLTLAAIRARIGARGRWAMIVLAVILPAAIGFPVALGLGNLTPDEYWILALFLPYGIAWILVGLRMIARGAPTLVDPRPSTSQPEVRGA